MKYKDGLGPRMKPQPDANLVINRYQYARLFVERMKEKSAFRVVFDLGAGQCEMRAAVEAVGYKWLGFDLHPANPDVVRWDLADPCPIEDARADVVLMLDVIEHLLNPGIALRNVARALRPNGWLLLTMPNPRWSRSRTHHLLFGNLACFTEHDLKWNHHVFTPWRHIVEKVLNDAHFEIDEYVTLDGKTRWPKRSLSLSLPLLWIEAIGRMMLEWHDPSACGLSYGLVARLK